MPAEAPDSTAETAPEVTVETMVEYVQTPLPGLEEATIAPKRGRGRPRPAETQERDKVILAAIVDPITREALVAMTGLAPTLVYLALARLRRQGLIERRHENGKHVWARLPEN
jgi:hypothetical protein